MNEWGAKAFERPVFGSFPPFSPAHVKVAAAIWRKLFRHFIRVARWTDLETPEISIEAIRMIIEITTSISMRVNATRGDSPDLIGFVLDDSIMTL
jgi:hypothetical protein